MSSDEPSVDDLQNARDEQLVEGRFASAAVTQRRIEEQIGQPDQTAALEAGRDRRLHAPVDSISELQDRRKQAAANGFDTLAEEYEQRIEQLEDDEDDDEAALSEEEQTRAALAHPDDETIERTEAALGASDVISAAEHGLNPAAFCFAAYDEDPRTYEDEYKLRAALRKKTPKRLKQQDDGVSTARAALSVSERAELDHADQTAAELIEERHGIDPDQYEGNPEELRAAIVAQSGYESGVTDTSETNYSALSANRQNGNGR